MRTQLKKEEAFQLFAATLPQERLSIEESYETYYDSLEGHWGWWVRIEGQFVRIPADKREACDREVRDALLSLAEERGIPYTIHRLLWEIIDGLASCERKLRHIGLEASPKRFTLSYANIGRVSS
jgi:hypothetical protein